MQLQKKDSIRTIDHDNESLIDSVLGSFKKMSQDFQIKITNMLQTNGSQIKQQYEQEQQKSEQDSSEGGDYDSDNDSVLEIEEHNNHFNEEEKQNSKEKVQKIKINLKGTEKFRVCLESDIGELEGILTISNRWILFDPDINSFNKNYTEYLQQKVPRSVTKYEYYIDINDVCTVQLNQQLYNAQIGSFEIFLNLYIDDTQDEPAPIKDEYGNPSLIKIQFKSIEQFYPVNDDDSNYLGKTYMHYLAKKIQYSQINFKEDQQTSEKSVTNIHYYNKINIKNLHDNIKNQNRKKHQKLQYVKVIPQLDQKSSILTEEFVGQIAENLPMIFFGQKWYLIFNPRQDGFSYNTFLRRIGQIGPHIIVVQDKNNKIFGAYVSHGWKQQKTIFGDQESFLFTFKKYDTIRVFNWSRKKDNFQYCDQTGIVMGLDDYESLKIKENFVQGTSYMGETYMNQNLSDTQEFQIKNIEFWSLNPHTEMIIKQFSKSSINF